MRRLVHLSCLIAVGLWGCQGNLPDAHAPVSVVGTPAPEAIPFKDAPDDAAKQLAVLGVDSAVLMGPLIQKCQPFLSGYYDALGRHPLGAYHVLDSGISGWNYQNGWYLRADNTADASVQARLEDASGTPTAWDVASDANYAPDLQTAFPRDIARARFVADEKLPTGGAMSVTLFAPLGTTRPQSLDAFGSGAINATAPLGTTGFEALNATFPVSGDVQRGDIGLRTTAEAEILQFEGHFDQHGLVGGATLMRNGEAIASVTLVNGAWQLQNAGGTYPLQ
ncbi:MAG TPA: hypothetical protein V6D47_15115 [Oscillatoriaceae cyanobacterium]